MCKPISGRDKQLIHVGKWTVFKTSGDRDKDLLFISDFNLKIWTKYEISPEAIEQTIIWKKQNIESSIDNWDTVAKIKLIDSNGQITVDYTYAKKKRIPFFKISKRNLIYNIDYETGKLKLNKIIEV